MICVLFALAAASGGKVGRTIAFLGLEEVPPEFSAAVALVRSWRAVQNVYSRPARDRDDGSCGAFTAAGSNLKEGRHVRVDSDPLNHVRTAEKVRLPEPSFAQTLPAVLRAVCAAIVQKGDELPGFRVRQGQRLLELPDMLCDLDEVCRSRMAPHVHFVAAGVRVACMAALIEGLDFPDERLPEMFVTGFPIAGDGSAREPGQQDSGQFRSIVRDAVHSMTDLACGRAPNFLSNQRWLGRACAMLRSRARRPTADAAELMRKAEELCEAETMAAPRPTMMPGLTLRALSRWATLACGGIQRVRVVVRFVLRQGLKADGTPKYRGIDDLKQNGVNGACRTVESIIAISFLFPALVARAFVEAARKQRKPCPPLWFGCDDLKHAYRIVPIAAIWLSVVAIWSVRKGCVMFYRMPGHAFGAVASVVNFNRLPHFVCFVAQVIMLVAVDHYCDDFCSVDPAAYENSAHDALRLVLIVLGFDVSMEKRQWAAPSNTFLGILVNIANAHRAGGYATAEPTKKRIAKALEALRACKARGSISAIQASKLRGWLGFLLIPVHWRFGRSAMQPLGSARQGVGSTHQSWGRPLQAMHSFFERVLPHLPPLRVPMAATRERPVLVYTDASFWIARGKRIATLGFYVLDPTTGVEVYSKLVLPEEFYRYFAPDKKTYIAQAELLVAVAVYYSVPCLLKDRAAMHFIDNVVALSAVVKGYASKADCAILVNCLHEAVLELRTHLWAEWIPSKANPADWPTRPELEHLIPSTAVFIPMVLPSVEKFMAMLNW